MHLQDFGGLLASQARSFLGAVLACLAARIVGSPDGFSDCGSEV